MIASRARLAQVILTAMHRVPASLVLRERMLAQQPVALVPHARRGQVTKIFLQAACVHRALQERLCQRAARAIVLVTTATQVFIYPCDKFIFCFAV